MTAGADLYRLQELDSAADSTHDRLAKIAVALNDHAQLQQARQALERAQALAKKWAVQQRGLELDIQSLTDKTSGSEQRLYSGMVKNPKELSDLQAEVASLKRRQLKLEDDLLDAMVEREDAEEMRARAQQRSDEIQALWTIQQADLLAEQETLEEGLREIEQEREGLLPRVDSGNLTTYEHLRRRKGGIAVTSPNGEVCGICGVAISPSLKWKLREGEIIYCGTCERIIVPIQ